MSSSVVFLIFNEFNLTLFLNLNISLPTVQQKHEHGQVKFVISFILIARFFHNFYQILIPSNPAAGVIKVVFCPPSDAQDLSNQACTFNCLSTDQLYLFWSTCSLMVIIFGSCFCLSLPYRPIWPLANCIGNSFAFRFCFTCLCRGLFVATLQRACSCHLGTYFPNQWFPWTGQHEIQIASSL